MNGIGARPEYTVGRFSAKFSNVQGTMMQKSVAFDGLSATGFRTVHVIDPSNPLRPSRSNSRQLDGADQPAASHLVLLCHFSVSTLDWSLEATRASGQCVDEVDGKASSQCCDGVGDVALRPDGRRRAGGSLGIAQVPRSSRG